MRKRPGTCFGVVVSVLLTVLISVDQAYAQTPSMAAVAVTFPSCRGISTALTGQGRFRPWWGCMGVVALCPRTTAGPTRCNKQWGYVALLVDSLSPRGTTNICDSPRSVDPQYARMPDAYAAKAYLARQPFVDDTRIAVMGWSHGGSTALYAVDNIYLDRINAVPFTAAIALSPEC
jgi:hypothetical protein